MSTPTLNAFETYRNSLSRLREKLDDVRPNQAHLKDSLLARLDAIEPKMRSLTLEEFEMTWLRPPVGSVLHTYKNLSAEIHEASDPRTQMVDCVAGGLYRVRCRNSNCGIWLPEQNGFQIARTKFEDTYIFVETHIDAGGTARPYEMLDWLSPDAGDTERLALLLRWRDQLGAY